MAVLIHISAKRAIAQIAAHPRQTHSHRRYRWACNSPFESGREFCLEPSISWSYNWAMLNRGCEAHRALRILFAALSVSSLLLVVSCATSKGATLEKVIAAQGAPASSRYPANPPQEPVQNPPGTTKGLQVLTDPSSAEVWIDGDFKGLTPFVWEDISVGWHRVILRKEGYYESSGWVEFKGDPMLYQASLAEIIGFLQVSATPADVTVTVDGREIPAGTQQVRAGTHVVEVRSFGYTPYTASVVINEKAVTALSVTLEPAPFDVTDFSVPKAAVNPANPGLIGPHLDAVTRHNAS